jgi:hypothetical protein
MDFFEDQNILIGTVCVCADGFPGHSKAFHYQYTIINFSFSFLKLLYNLENAFWIPPQHSVICDWSIFEAGYWKDFQN